MCPFLSSRTRSHSIRPRMIYGMDTLLTAGIAVRRFSLHKSYGGMPRSTGHLIHSRMLTDVIYATHAWTMRRSDLILTDVADCVLIAYGKKAMIDEQDSETEGSAQ